MSQYNDLVAVGEMAKHIHQMVMIPRLWSSFRSTHALNWVAFPFAAASRTRIPDQPGVYAFLVAPAIAGDLNVSYLMYIGKTDRTLRKRFSEYLREAARDNIRPNLLRVLPLYPDHLVFACATLPATVAPIDVESALLEAFVPPYNSQLPATVSRARKAF